MTMTRDTPRGAEYELAPDVAFTTLPFGGAVLVNGTTFAVVECRDGEAVMIEKLLDSESNYRDLLDHGTAIANLSARLLADGWLVRPGKQAR